MAPEIAPRVRECMQKSIEMTKELCGQVVSCVREIEQSLTPHDLENVSPLVLQCIYTCASNMLWMAVETGNPRYNESKSICEDMLHAASSRWEVADVYLEMQRLAELTLKSN
ncbi:fungal-specific transcription factor domain protein [Penicillium antarcticum]|uniref:fungal-specific transcription factor domain protein n=1 Tax=Penicillium antarcticum TaxID=416450 RepID=UPI00238CE39A|nr:fungal-specific transcription factor domain protein [Penicillium antarcticum]KAJ5311983.1 fungal-specific transcription factor domain protein [Penicillium antarcticum]